LNKRIDVVGFGSAAIDNICIINSIASYRGTTFISDLKVYSGGCVPTALVTLQRLGTNTAFISSLGDDWRGEKIISDLTEEGVDCCNIQINKGLLSPFSFIQVNEKFGKRAIAHYQGSIKMLRFDKSVESLIQAGKILHIDGLLPQEQIKAAIFAHKNGLKVMIDAHVIVDGIYDLLKHVDFIITSRDFLTDFTRCKDTESSLDIIYKMYKPEILVTTLGEKGSIEFSGNGVVYINGFNVDVKDTTGAGDVYHGSFIFGILNNWNIREIMTFASAVAALKCKHYGGREGIPNLEETQKFLQDNGIDYIVNYQK